MVVAVFFGVALFEAKDLPFGVQISPLLAASMGFSFTLVLLVKELRQSAKATKIKQEGLTDLSAEQSLSPGVLPKRAITIIAWLLGLYLGIWLVGFKIAIAIFFILFMKLDGRIGWLINLGLTAVAIFLLIIYFGGMLGVVSPQSLFQRWFELPWFLE